MLNDRIKIIFAIASGICMLGVGCEDKKSGDCDCAQQCSDLVNAVITDIERANCDECRKSEICAAMAELDGSKQATFRTNWLERIISADLSGLNDYEKYIRSYNRLKAHKDQVAFEFLKDGAGPVDEYLVRILWLEWMSRESGRLAIYKDDRHNVMAQGDRLYGMREAYETVKGEYEMFVRVLEREFDKDVLRGNVSANDALLVRELFEKHIGRPIRTVEDLNGRRESARSISMVTNGILKVRKQEQ